MSYVDKIIDKMKRQPNGIRPEEAEKVLNAFGYQLVRQKGLCDRYSQQNYIIERKLKNGSKGLYEITIYQVGTGNE